MLTEFTPIVVQAPQLSPEWFKARLGNVTGSMVKVTMEYYSATLKHVIIADEWYDIHPDAYPVEVRQRLRKDYWDEYCLRAGMELKEKATRQNYRRGIVAERLSGVSMTEGAFQNKAMQWGQQQERWAKKAYSLKYGHQVQDAPLFLHPELMTGASPDGLVIDVDTGELGNCECKSLEMWNHLYKIVLPEKVPDDYIPQIQHQMWIDGRAWCDFIGYDPRMKKEILRLFVKRVERDDFYINEVLIPSVVRFLDECDAEERQFYAIQKKREQMAAKSYWGSQSLTVEEVEELAKSEAVLTPLDVEKLKAVEA